MFNSTYIARFLSAEDTLKYILADDSTFCLNSTAYYRTLENKKGCVKDRAENEAYFEEESTTYETNEALISCWTKLIGDRPNKADWDYWQQYNRVIAIVSTVEKISGFLQSDLTMKELCKKGVLFDFDMDKDHKEVSYYEKKRPADFDELKVYFCKRNEFVKQNEYRFALRVKGNFVNIRTVSFATRPNEYIECIDVSPDLRKDNPKLNKILVWAGIHKISVRT